MEEQRGHYYAGEGEWAGGAGGAERGSGDGELGGGGGVVRGMARSQWPIEAVWGSGGAVMGRRVRSGLSYLAQVLN
jgi:hypothetical protein